MVWARDPANGFVKLIGLAEIMAAGTLELVLLTLVGVACMPMLLVVLALLTIIMSAALSYASRDKVQLVIGTVVLH